MRADTLEKVHMAMQGPSICSTLDCELEEEAPAQQSSEWPCWLCPGHDGTEWETAWCTGNPALQLLTALSPTDHLSGCEDNGNYFPPAAERSRFRELDL